MEKKKKEISDNTTLIKQDIGKAFEELRMKLQKKEREIIERTDIYLQENLQELNTYSRIINSKIISLNRIIDNINSNIVRKDEITLLNFFADNRGKVVQASESDIPDIPSLETVNKLSVCVNQDSLETLINNLNSIHMEITSMKGVKISQVPKIHKVKRDIYGNISQITNKKNDKVLDNLSYDFSRNNNLVKLNKLEYFI